MHSAYSNDELVQDLVNRGVLSTFHIISAFRHIDRKDFVQEKSHAYADVPLSIGFGQTISQPSTVAFMLELLQPSVGEKILDIGSGSGWTTALLASAVGNEGEVTGLEIVPELVKFGSHNLKKYGFRNAKILRAKSGTLGIPGQTFDKILVSAGATDIPEQLFSQINVGGMMVIPIQHSLIKITRTAIDTIEQKEFPGFLFVPLIY